MRPINLRLEGFTSFRSVTEIDFSRLDIFAIVGPTGAGKTSLIDAMTYALYGCTPRVGERNVSELIHLACNQASVLFEFAAGDQRYRIARSVKRTSKSVSSQRQLEHMVEPGVWSPLASSDRDVRHNVKKIVGLDFQGFIRAVVLPQGQFDQFLKGDVGERRRILSDLLQLTLYEKMGRLARGRSKEAATRREMLQLQLETEFVDATDAHRLSLQEQLTHHQREFETLGSRLEVLSGAQALLAEMQATHKQLAQLEEQTRRLTGRLDATRKQRDQAGVELQALQQQSHRIAESKTRVRYDDGLYLRLTEIRPQAHRLEGLEPSLQALRRELKSLQKEQSVCVEPRPLLKEEVAALEKDLSSLGEDLERATREQGDMSRTYPSIETLLTLQQEARQTEKLRTKLQDTLTGVEEAGAAREALERTQQALQSRLHGVRLDLEQVESEAEEVRRSEWMHQVRSSLEPGQQCPVCRQSVDDESLCSHPPAPAAVASGRHDQLLDQAARLESEMADCRADLVLKDKETRLLEGNRTSLREEIESLGAGWRDAFPDLQNTDPVSFLAALIPKVQRAAASIHEVESRRTRRSEQLRQRVRSLEEIDSRLALLDREVETIRSRIGELEGERSQLQATLGEWSDSGQLEQTYQRLGKARDALQELEREEKRLAVQVAQSSQAIQSLKQQALEIEAEQRGLAAALADAKEESEKLKERAEATLGESGLDLSLLLPGRLQKQIEADSAESARLSSAVGSLEEKLSRTRAAIKRAAQIRNQCRELAGREAAAHQLGLDLRSSELLAFIQEEALARLAQGASKHLQQFSSGRYRFTLSGGAFAVLDDWNAREVRSATTLSGGESFLASLALAVALSESLTSFCTGTEGLRLESLFLDEGFATLDPDTLELVLDAVEALALDDRQIGVVSHIPALASRLPHRIRVSKAMDGSTVQVQ